MAIGVRALAGFLVLVGCDGGADGPMSPSGDAGIAPVEDAGPGEPSCAAGCAAVYGYPEDPARGCVDRAQRAFLGCDCNPAASSPRCGRRTSDDTLWTFHADELDTAAGFAMCTSDELDRVLSGCHFADCQHPPLSVCTVEATCADRGCDNLEFDAHGCHRPPCESDADCADDTRCVQIACVSTSFCSVVNAAADESCGCGGPAPCIPGSACNPVATVGPRGAWRRLEFVDVNQICMAGCSGECPQCNGIRSVDASGSITVRPMGTTEPRTAMLDADDRSALERVVDGPTLRAGLRDGLGCEFLGADSTTALRLELTDATFVQDVTSCVIRGEDNEVARLYQLLSAY